MVVLTNDAISPRRNVSNTLIKRSSDSACGVVVEMTLETLPALVAVTAGLELAIFKSCTPLADGACAVAAARIALAASRTGSSAFLACRLIYS